MGKLSLREAAKVYNVSRPTLSKALRDGRISGEKAPAGHWLIDPAEIERIWVPRKGASDTPGTTGRPDDVAVEIERLKARAAELTIRARVAEARADAAEGTVRIQERHIDDLRRLLPAASPSRSRRPWWRF